MSIRILFLGLLSATFALGNAPNTYLKLRKGSGYVPFEMSQYSECTLTYQADMDGLYVFSNRTIAGMKIEDVRFAKNVVLAELKKKITEAAKGNIEVAIGPVDGPTTEYFAYENGKEIPLLSEGTGENKKNT